MIELIHFKGFVDPRKKKNKFIGRSIRKIMVIYGREGDPNGAGRGSGGGGGGWPRVVEIKGPPKGKKRRRSTPGPWRLNSFERNLEEECDKHHKRT